VFIRPCHWSLSWARCIQLTLCHPVSLRSIQIFSYVFWVVSCLQVCRTKFYMHFSCLPRVPHVLPTLALLDLITLIIYGEAYELKWILRKNVFRFGGRLVFILFEFRHMVFLFFLLTNYMVQNLTWEDADRPASCEVPAFYGIQTFITVFTTACHWSFLSQMNPLHTFPPYFPKINSNIVFPSTPVFWAVSSLQVLHRHRRRLSRIRPIGLFRFRIYFLKLMNLLDSW